MEFYVILEIDEKGVKGRLTESMFRMSPDADNKMVYYEKIAGDFTLDKRAAGFKNVILVGTGTGLAPFISMAKQLDFEAKSGTSNSVRYTLLHTNRTYEELDYYQDLLDIEAAQRFDFVYVPSVSRPTQRDWDDPKLGRGRANNMLRYLLEMPLKEEQDLQEIAAKGGDVAKAKAVLEKTVKPALPKHLTREALRDRMDPRPVLLLPAAIHGRWKISNMPQKPPACDSKKKTGRFRSQVPAAVNNGVGLIGVAVEPHR